MKKNKCSPSNNDELTISQIINKYKISYKHFKPVYSPAIDDNICFNMSGFKHLIFKGKHRRPNRIIYSRMVLIPLIRPVIKNCNKITEIRNGVENVKGKELNVEYCALEAIQSVMKYN